MSCVLSNIGCFYDITAVQRYLFPNWKKEEEKGLTGEKTENNFILNFNFYF